MKDAIANAPLDLKGFLTVIVGSLANFLGYLGNLEPVQLMGLLLAFAGFIVQISAYLKNRAETARSNTETQLKIEENKRAEEMHNAQMSLIRKTLEVEDEKHE